MSNQGKHLRNYSIAIASGKGGTGKTTLAVSLYRALADRLAGNVIIADCDVEEPNVTLFFPEAVEIEKTEVQKKVAVISKVNCSFCRKCVEYCEFNAIVVLPSAEFAEVNSDLCHSCGACLVACEYNAITEIPETIGVITQYSTDSAKGISEGRLRIGSTMQTMLIRHLKRSLAKAEGIVIYDAPPGTSCPVVETVSDTDYVILVAEPTPFGLHDLKLMVELLNEMKKEFGIVINKAGLGDNQIYQFIEEGKIDILGEIPFSKTFAQAYSTGDIINNIPEEIYSQFELIAAGIHNRILDERDHNT